MPGIVRTPTSSTPIHDCPPPLLDLTIDQLRTLLAVHQTGSPLAAARLLSREHSSVRKQVDKLNDAFTQMCGEPICIRQGRGQNYLFTPTGEQIAAHCRGMLGDWLTEISARRRKLGASITIATTEFTVDFLAQAWPLVADEFTRREIELTITHARTRDFWQRLDAQEVDLVCGSIAAAPDNDPIHDNYDVIEWHREPLALITNLTTRELPLQAVPQNRLPDIPLLAPAVGVIAEFLRRWYGPDFARRLTIVAEVDSIYYGLALLRSGLTHGALVCAHAVAQATIEGRLPGSPNLRLVPLTADYHPSLQLLAGIFGRRNERHNYDPSHPLNLLWAAFAATRPAAHHRTSADRAPVTRQRTH
ncbi:LysR family transcriptional regulator [Nocardia terpenica]|uniref:LysR family transcriptional regulator n=1 Tax=Nocardia terpenica TaxID=455432 RepID=A0A164I2E3_9NOCA|nr:LysR family transcriptional regulator [Nocardia terpenica]KZM69040.1 LysR family transcriptional regulator [Nocardia terpenica]NQE87865.1 LysR family transcriptional regulator [Nocardia terpenica]